MFDLVVWTILVTIAINDIKQHKIPNSLLLLLLTYSFFNILYSNESYLDPSLGFLSWFCVTFVLYLCRIMSPGDVKLLGVVGFIVGFTNSLEAVYFIAIGIIATGSFYLLHNISKLGVSNPLYILFDRRLRSIHNGDMNNRNIDRYKNKLTMPFAPSVVIGLVLYSYFK